MCPKCFNSLSTLCKHLHTHKSHAPIYLYGQSQFFSQPHRIFRVRAKHHTVFITSPFNMATNRFRHVAAHSTFHSNSVRCYTFDCTPMCVFVCECVHAASHEIQQFRLIQMFNAFYYYTFSHMLAEMDAFIQAE